jgi:hypothetical protein
VALHTTEVVLVLRFYACTVSIHERRPSVLSWLGSGWGGEKRRGEERRVLGVVFAIDRVLGFYATTVFM